MSEAVATTSDVYKTATMILAGIVLSLIACLWNQSRDMATKQDIVGINANVQNLQAQMNILNANVNEMRGEMTAQAKLKP